MEIQAKSETATAGNVKLTPKQKLFVFHYLKNKNAYQAAISAGYSKKSAAIIGYENLQKPYIQQKIDEELGYQEQRTLVTADYVIASLRKVAERCLRGEEVFDKRGNPTGVWQFDSAGANKALELLGRYKGLWEDKGSVVNVEKIVIVRSESQADRLSQGGSIDINDRIFTPLNSNACAVLSSGKGK